MATSDDIARLTSILVRQHQDGTGALIRRQRSLPIGKLAKVSGAQWLDCLYSLAPSPAAALHRSAAAQAERQAAEQAKAAAAEGIEW